MRKIISCLVAITVCSLSVLITGVLLPREINTQYPIAWGRMERLTGSDMTGFAFTPWAGFGNCRIRNSQEAFKREGSKIVFGEISIHDKRGNAIEIAHLWALGPKGGVVDLTCPPRVPRRIFAIVDASTLTLEFAQPANSVEQQQIAWTINYLHGLKPST